MIEQAIPVGASIETGPAALIVQIANRFSSTIQVKMEDKIVNAKSIMGIISLGILNGQEVTIIANGEDEKEAVAELMRFLNKVEK